MAYQPPEVQYEHALAVNHTRRGPLRFEEGVATDTDIPNDFGLGAYGDTAGDARGRPFLNVKDPDETMRERAHVGSCFVDRGTDDALRLRHRRIGVGQNGPEFEMELGSERRLIRLNPAMVND